jgi:hypothetical protein
MALALLAAAPMIAARITAAPTTLATRTSAIMTPAPTALAQKAPALVLIFNIERNETTGASAGAGRSLKEPSFGKEAKLVHKNDAVTALTYLAPPILAPQGVSGSLKEPHNF